MYKHLLNSPYSPLSCRYCRLLFQLLAAAVIACCGLGSRADAINVPPPLRDQLIRAAGDMLDNASISYAYGGRQLNAREICEQCNRCIEKKKPAPKRQLAVCPICQNCSLDCSHFIQLVFERVGVKFPYITTQMMLDLSPGNLKNPYGFYDVGFSITEARKGDLLVYHGHVVLLEKIYRNGRGDIIHVTSGRDIRTPGQAIQRERNVDLASFRGSLRRILRHQALDRG
jgi:hypothetical protein